MASPFRGIFEDAQGIFDPGDALGMQGQRDAQRRLDERYKQMHQAYSQYRPEHAQSRNNALNQQLSAFGPINDLVQRMYGSGAGIDLASLGRNPMTGGAMLAGQGQAEPEDEGGFKLPLGLDPLTVAAGLGLTPESFLTKPLAEGSLRSTRTADPAYGDIAAGAGYGATTQSPGQRENPGYIPTYGFRGPGR